MINRTIIMGRLTANPELRQTPNNVSVCAFAVAVDRSYKSGEERKTDFINVVAWRQTAEFVSKYFKKGEMIAVDGTLQTRNYTDKEGVKRTAFEIIADNISFCGNKQNGAAEGNVEKEEHTSTADDFTEVGGGVEDLPFN